MFAVKDKEKQQPKAFASVSKRLDGQIRVAPQVRELLNPFRTLQRNLGNSYFPSISQAAMNSNGLQIQSACACGSSCANCAAKKDKPQILQPKLVIGSPNDRYEQEADRVADQMMRMPEPIVQRQIESEEAEEETLQTQPLSEQITPLVQRQVNSLEEEEEEETLQTKMASSKQRTISSNLQNRITSLQGAGQPLSQSERAFFEPRFGVDFSPVRIHADFQAAEAAEAVNAHAFTLGQNIVFGAGQYDPKSSKGQHLLAHELTHTLQQKGKVTSSGAINIQRSFCPSVCNGRSLCRAPRKMGRNSCAESNAADNSNKISHIRVIRSNKTVTLFYNGTPCTPDGKLPVPGTPVDPFPCNPNSSETPEEYDKVGIKCPERYTNRNRYYMAHFTAFRSTGRVIGFHDSQPLTGGPSAGCVRVSCELAQRIKRDSTSNWTSIWVR